MKRWLLPFELIDMVVRFFAAVKVAVQRLGLTRPQCQRTLCVLVVCLVVVTALRATLAYGVAVVVASLVVGGLLAQRDIRSWFVKPAEGEALRESEAVAEVERVLAEAIPPR